LESAKKRGDMEIISTPNFSEKKKECGQNERARRLFMNATNVD
jgi:hypothetical protein